MAKVEKFRLHDLDYKYLDSGSRGKVDLNDKIEYPSGTRETVDSWLKGMAIEGTARDLISQNELSVRNFIYSLELGQNMPRLGELFMKLQAGTISNEEFAEYENLIKSLILYLHKN